LNSCNFKGWFEERRQEAITQLNIIYRRAILKVDLKNLITGKATSDLVDLYMRMWEHRSLETAVPKSEEGQLVIEKINEILKLLVDCLPKEMSVNLPQSSSIKRINSLSLETNTPTNSNSPSNSSNSKTTTSSSSTNKLNNFAASEKLKENESTNPLQDPVSVS